MKRRRRNSNLEQWMRKQFGKWVRIAILLIVNGIVEEEASDDVSCSIIMPREEVPSGRMCISIMSMTSVS